MIQTQNKTAYVNKSLQKQIHLSDIVASSVLTFIVIVLSYYGSERLGLVPIFNLHYNESSISVLETFTQAESMLYIFIMLELGWISAQLVYWRLIRRYRVIW